MKIKTIERCMSCKKVISNKRYYCFGCFQALEESSRIAEQQGDADYEAELKTKETKETLEFLDEHFKEEEE